MILQYHSLIYSENPKRIDIIDYNLLQYINNKII